MSDLRDTDTIVGALPVGIADFSNVGDADGLVGLGLDLLDGLGAVEGAVDFLEGGAAGLDEEEVDGDELDHQPAFEEEVELPAAGRDTDRDDILRQRQADVGRKTLHEQAVGADLEAENLEWVGYIEGDPMVASG